MGIGTWKRREDDESRLGQCSTVKYLIGVSRGDGDFPVCDFLHQIIAHTIVGNTVTGLKCRRDSLTISSSRSCCTNIGISPHRIGRAGHHTRCQRGAILQTVHAESISIVFRFQRGTVKYLYVVDGNGQGTRSDHLLQVIDHSVVSDIVAGGEGCRYLGIVRSRGVNVGFYIFILAGHHTAQGSAVLQATDSVTVGTAIGCVAQRAHKLQTVVHLRRIEGDVQRTSCNGQVGGCVADLVVAGVGTYFCRTRDNLVGISVHNKL